ncbi:MAG: hypothetical protein ACLPN6_08430, partial [Streptosporangiaceae bacterium]
MVPVPGHIRRRWSGYLGLAVLIGPVGGVAMGSVVAARRTDAPTHRRTDAPTHRRTDAPNPKFLAST